METVKKKSVITYFQYIIIVFVVEFLRDYRQYLQLNNLFYMYLQKIRFGRLKKRVRLVWVNFAGASPSLRREIGDTCAPLFAIVRPWQRPGGTILYGFYFDFYPGTPLCVARAMHYTGTDVDRYA